MTGIVMVCLAAALWGTVGVANRLMTEPAAVEPVLAGLTRTALGAASLLLAAWVLRVPWRRPPLRLLATFGLAGAVFQICLFAAFAQVGVTVTVAVTVCTPVVLVVAADALWRRRWPEFGACAAIAIAALGVALAMVGGVPRGGPEAVDWRGVALLSTASVAYAVVAASARLIARELHPLRATGLGLAITAAALACAALARPAAAPAVLATLPMRDLAILGYTGVAATGGAYLAFVLGLHLSRTAASGLAATLIEPGVAALLAALVLRERLVASETFGCALMLAAMVVLFLAEAARAAGTRAASPPAAEVPVIEPAEGRPA
jgi:DME family drug/metabolite transporter